MAPGPNSRRGLSRINRQVSECRVRPIDCRASSSRQGALCVSFIHECAVERTNGVVTQLAGLPRIQSNSDARHSCRVGGQAGASSGAPVFYVPPCGGLVLLRKPPAPHLQRLARARVLAVALLLLRVEPVANHYRHGTGDSLATNQAATRRNQLARKKPQAKLQTQARNLLLLRILPLSQNPPRLRNPPWIICGGAAAV